MRLQSLNINNFLAARIDRRAVRVRRLRQHAHQGAGALVGAKARRAPLPALPEGAE